MLLLINLEWYESPLDIHRDPNWKCPLDINLESSNPLNLIICNYAASLKKIFSDIL